MRKPIFAKSMHVFLNMRLYILVIEFCQNYQRKVWNFTQNTNNFVEILMYFVTYSSSIMSKIKTKKPNLLVVSSIQTG